MNMLEDLFTTNEVINISGLTRNNLEYYRRENILYPVSDKPLRWDYKNLFFCLIINELRKLEPRNTALKLSVSLLNSNLDFIEDNTKILIFSDSDTHTQCIKLKDEWQILQEFENENKDFLKYYKKPYFLRVKDENLGVEVQIGISEYYILYMDYAKEHLNKLCIDYDCEGKIPSFSKS